MTQEIVILDVDRSQLEALLYRLMLCHVPPVVLDETISRTFHPRDVLPQHAPMLAAVRDYARQLVPPPALEAPEWANDLQQQQQQKQLIPQEIRTVGDFKQLFAHAEDDEPLELVLISTTTMGNVSYQVLKVLNAYSSAGGRAMGIRFLRGERVP